LHETHGLAAAFTDESLKGTYASSGKSQIPRDTQKLFISLFINIRLVYMAMNLLTFLSGCTPASKLLSAFRRGQRKASRCYKASSVSLSRLKVRYLLNEYLLKNEYRSGMQEAAIKRVKDIEIRTRKIGSAAT
jgi:hypothetical protein